MTGIESLGNQLSAKKRWLIHVAFWIFVLILYSLFFSNRAENYWETLLLVAMLMPIAMGSTYFLNYFLLPRYLLRERYGAFLVYFLYTLIGALFLEMSVVVAIFILVAKLNARNMNPATVNIPFLIAALLMIVFLGGAIKMLSHWRNFREDNQRLMKEKVEAELRFLKLQLNPHFLFNTLNNLYFLASEKSDKAPRAILALSELLDYILNETKKNYVPLDDEIRLIRNYVELEQLRYEDRIRVELNVSGDTANSTVPPLVLLTLVENAFKHGAGKSNGNHDVVIRINSEKARIDVNVSNSYDATKTTSRGGIGLINLRDQLQLLYGGGHSLIVSPEAGIFKVNLELRS